MLRLNLEDHIEDRLLVLMRGSDADDPHDRTRRDLANRIAEGITMIIEGTALQPTEKQIRYAVSIARELSLQIPAEVLQFRDAMTAFIGTYAEQYRRRKGYGAAQTRTEGDVSVRQN